MFMAIAFRLSSSNNAYFNGSFNIFHSQAEIIIVDCNTNAT